MKKIICLLVVSVFFLVGCSQDKKTTTSKTNESQGYVFKVKDVDIAMNEKTDDFIKSLGKELEYFEAPSCAFKGLDKTYTYAGFQLKTYPKDEVDYVNAIVLTDDTVKTAEGICIGDSKDQVVEKYGKDFKEKSGGYVYTKDKSELEFIFDGDSVSAITYTAITK
ncbi:MAG: hypothetical protein KHZ15_14430 [Coprobacillus cateniformis]|uniref:hypothetical protein n=1 Tax=Longibaculum muris TaxID=1796628 RepID=UPI0012B8EED9|nr:hypothetical protein [Longibaculum muris]MBS5113855.1 hypothetical protein [Coprobacillus cateniformis]